jgi:hypothetical protein
MVSKMPVASIPWGSWGVAGRLTLIAGYVLLVLLLNPVVLQHELAAASDLPHADRDFCTWLDHAAGSTLQSSAVIPVVVEDSAQLSLLPAVFSFFRQDHSDPVRGPPVSF